VEAKPSSSDDCADSSDGSAATIEILVTNMADDQADLDGQMACLGTGSLASS